MKLYDDFKFEKEIPKYIQLAEFIKSLIDKRMIKDGDKLPTIRALAKKLNVSTSSVNAWEKEKTYPSLINVLSLCNYFDVEVDDLIGVSSMINL